MKQQVDPSMPSDLALLGSYVLQGLNKVFPFKRSTILDAAPEEGLKKIAISPRQKSRALETLNQQQGFWDRVGEQIILPVHSHGTYQGMVVLHEPPCTASPDEAARWLPLLIDWINRSLALTKEEATAAPIKQPPRLLEEIFKNHFLSHYNANYLLYLKFNTTTDLSLKQDQITSLVNNIFSKGFFLGGNFKELWYLTTFPEEMEQGAGILHKFFMNVKSSGFGLKKVLLSRLESEKSDWKIQIETFNNLDRISSLLDSDIFTTPALENLEKIFNIDSLPKFIKKTTTLKNNLTSSNLLIYVSPLTKSLIKHLSSDPHYKIVTGSDSSVFLTTPLSDEPLTEQAEKFHTFLKENSNKKTTAGFYNKNKMVTPSPKGPFGPLWAFRHASLLGEGQKALFDDVTLNVIGDEMFAWGDLPGSLRHYKRGVKLDPQNSNLWNSLGVCLAQMGKKKDAIQAFQRATKLAPIDFMGFYNLACAYLANNQENIALKNFKKALTIKPDNLAAATRLSVILLNKGRFKEVLKLMEPLITDKGKIPAESLQVTAEAYWKTGNWPKSKQLWQRVLDIQPNNKKALAYLALGYAQKAKDPETAKRLCQTIHPDEYKELLSKKDSQSLSKALGKALP